MQAVHVYFPDPWWKKRHHKRRVFTPEFAADCGRVLRPGGRLHVATDVEEYFHASSARSGRPAGIRADYGGKEADGAAGGRTNRLTNFERKARRGAATSSRGVRTPPRLGSRRFAERVSRTLLRVANLDVPALYVAGGFPTSGFISRIQMLRNRTGLPWYCRRIGCFGPRASSYCGGRS